MPLDLPPELIAAKNKRLQESPWIKLLEIPVPDDPIQVIRITSDTQPTLWDKTTGGTDLTWVPYHFAFGEIVADTQGTIPLIELKLSNLARQLSKKLIEHRFLAKQRVRLIIVHESTLSDATKRIEFTMEVREGDCDLAEARLKLAAYNFHNVYLPTRRATQAACGWKYGGVLCQFDIDTLDPGMTILGPCQKRPEDCRTRGVIEVASGVEQKHPRRAGYFIGMPVRSTG